jgi:ABC-type proline/glycine betaine transport system permease subunit
MSIITPFIAPILAVVIGLPVGIALFRRLATRPPGAWVLPACVVLACVAAGSQLVAERVNDFETPTSWHLLSDLDEFRC